MDDIGRTHLIAGVDEAGRGPLAGPVIAAAVILDPARPILGLADSKKLSEKQRDKLFIEIRQHALAWSVRRQRHNDIFCRYILRKPHVVCKMPGFAWRNADCSNEAKIAFRCATGTA